MIGKLLEIRTGMFVVPYEQKEHGFLCVVVHNVTGNDAYKVGGYNILVFQKEIDASRTVDLRGVLS